MARHENTPISFYREGHGKTAQLITNAVKSNVKNVKDFDAFVRAEIAAGRVTKRGTIENTVRGEYDYLVRRGHLYVDTPIPEADRRLPEVLDDKGGDDPDEGDEPPPPPPRERFAFARRFRGSAPKPKAAPT